MTRTAYLRVYQPLTAFAESDSSEWLNAPPDNSAVEERVSRRWLVASSMPEVSAAGADGAFVREVDGDLYVCPWRTRLRMLAGMLAFRGSVPDEIAEAFVPEDEARRAAHELALLGDERPEVRSHILHANWHVPLRWFAAFADDERVLTEDKDGLRLRYETKLSSARERLQRCVDILDERWVDDSVVSAIRELLQWIEEFDGEGLVELDYGTVATMFEPDELVDDRSANEVQTCLDALSAGDVMVAGRLFSTLTDRWTALRAQEVVN